MNSDSRFKYCPQCDDEYRYEIEKCGSCGVLLINGEERQAREERNRHKRASRAGAITSADETVRVHRGPLQELRRIELLLHAERIATLIEGDESTCGKGCCPTVFFLAVRKNDAQDALEILREEFKRATAWDAHDTSLVDEAFDPLAGEATCPACGHTFATSTATCPECGLCFA